MVIKGNVFDSYGNLDGATIVLMRDGKRTNVAVVSDANGNFQIDNDEIKSDDIFEIRYIGYLTQELSATKLSNASIQMKESAEQLDEIIITANIGKKPKTPSTEITSKNTTNTKWFKSPIVLIPTIAILTLGTVLLIVNKFDK